MAARAERALRAVIAGRVKAYAGLDPPDWLLDARLAERAQALDLPLEDYLARAAGDDGEAGRELEALSELLRVGETRFFRHQAQVHALRVKVIPERARAATLGGRVLRAWSAGCATGEEAWTLAMLLDLASPALGWEVLGTDLSDEALATARAGRYAEDKRADVPGTLAARYFEGDAIGEALRGHVRFEQHNLLEPRWRMRGPFDIILCRNVLIYFDAEARHKVIAQLAASLHEGGYLFVGYSETLRDEAAFEQLRDQDGVIWRRRSAEQLRRRTAAAGGEPEGALRSPLPHPPPASRPRVEGASPRVEEASPRVEGASPRVEGASPRVEGIALRGDYHDAARLREELKAVLGAPRAILDLDGAEYLGDEAARVLKRALEAAPGLELRASRPSVRRWLVRHGLRGSAHK